MQINNIEKKARGQKELLPESGFGGQKAKICLSEDFNEPLEDFKDLCKNLFIQQNLLRCRQLKF